jgi:4-amino-4-deoxy-L-arabinose transferase-like glycosyltransferase
VYVLFGHRYAAVRVFHCLIGTATILLVYWIGQFCFGRLVGLLAAGVYTVWPTSLLYSGALLSEPLGTFWLMGYVAASLSFARRPSGSRALWAGLLLGLSIVTRPNAGLMVPLAGLWAVYQFRRHTRVVVLALAIPALSLLALAPWAFRNYVVFDTFIPLSTGGGDVFLGANNSVIANDPIYYGYWIWPGDIPEYQNALRPLNNEVERDRVARKLAVRWLKENRDKWWYLVHSRVRRGWTPMLFHRSPKLYRVGMLLSWTPILTLMLMSFFPTLLDFLRKGQPGWLLHLVILHVVAGSIVFWGSSRFRYPVEGLCIILACATLVWAYRSLRGRWFAVPTSSA